MERRQEEATVSVTEAHRLIGPSQISKGALYDAVRRGDIPSMRLGGRILIPREWLARQLKGSR
jgi:excisionase family DNA binding protein